MLSSYSLPLRQHDVLASVAPKDELRSDRRINAEKTECVESL